MQKSEKSLEPFLRKLRYQPTNQPTNYYQQHRSYRTSLTPVQKYVQFITCIFLLKSMYLFKFWKISRFVENLETTPRSIHLELLIIGVVF